MLLEAEPCWIVTKKNSNFHGYPPEVFPSEILDCQATCLANPSCTGIDTDYKECFLVNNGEPDRVGETLGVHLELKRNGCSSKCFMCFCVCIVNSNCAIKK